jgi:heptosyltransferase-1
MRVLVVKTSSMGDLIHTLPALTDAHKAIPDIRFDWVAEQGFAEIPSWHPAVDKVIPIAIRRWRKALRQSWKAGEIQAAFGQLRASQYDLIIDAQGLFKSAVVARSARGKHYGMDWQSCRAPLATVFYERKIPVSKQQHAILRVRQLFSEVLAYALNSQNLDYGLSQSGILKHSSPCANIEQAFLVFLHGTSRLAKYWQQEQWIELAKLAEQTGYIVYLPWGNDYERDYAEAIAAQTSNAKVLAKMSLSEIAALLAQAKGVVGVDTGLAHLTAALNVPAVTLYIETFPSLTGACGVNQTCLSEQKMDHDALPVAGLKNIYHEQLTADVVWRELAKKL